MQKNKMKKVLNYLARDIYHSIFSYTGIRGRLMESLTNKLNGKPYNPMTYIAQDKRNLPHLLLQEASDISRVKKVSSADLEFWKLAVSSTINFMHPIFEARLSKLFTGQQLDTMKGHMNDQKKAFQNTETSELIDPLFDSLLLYQLEQVKTQSKWVCILLTISYVHLALTLIELLISLMKRNIRKKINSLKDTNYWSLSGSCK